jgi:hypothetical protein
VHYLPPSRVTGSTRTVGINPCGARHLTTLWQLSKSRHILITGSTTENLAAKRHVVIGDRAYVVGTQDRNFTRMGFRISGHVNGVWAHPVKLLDSYVLFLTCCGP